MKQTKYANVTNFIEDVNKSLQSNDAAFLVDYNNKSITIISCRTETIYPCGINADAYIDPLINLVIDAIPMSFNMMMLKPNVFVIGKHHSVNRYVAKLGIKKEQIKPIQETPYKKFLK